MLGIDDIIHEVMKTNMKKEYTRRKKKALTSKLEGGNVIKAINSDKVSLLQCSGGVINWMKSELVNLSHKTRRFMTMHGTLHPRSNVNCLYLQRREGGTD